MKPTLAELAREHAARRLPQKKRNAELRGHGYNPDGADGAAYRKIFFGLIGGHTESVALWIFPREDFPAWLKECHAGGPIKSYEAYLAEFETIATAVAARGLTIRRRTLRVAEMLAALQSRGWANTPENRARVIAEENPGLKSGPSAVGIAGGEEPLRPGETAADAAKRVLPPKKESENE